MAMNSLSKCVIVLIARDSPQAEEVSLEMGI